MVLLLFTGYVAPVRALTVVWEVVRSYAGCVVGVVGVLLWLGAARKRSEGD